MVLEGCRWSAEPFPSLVPAGGSGFSSGGFQRKKKKSKLQWLINTQLAAYSCHTGSGGVVPMLLRFQSSS